jgi:hypothetical protein
VTRKREGGVERWMKERDEAVFWKIKTIEQARIGCESAAQEGKRYSHGDRQHERCLS